MKPRRELIDRIASEGWAKGARVKPCARCGRKRGPVRGHHIIYQQELKRIAHDLGLSYERLRWDDRNRMPLCDPCHERHHSAMSRIPMAVVREAAPKATQFAAELDRQYEDGRSPAIAFLERTYP